MATKKAKNESNVPTITLAAFNELKAELENRENVLRLEIAEEIAAARELGDLSENHAYTDAMEKKELNENRIAELESLLAIAKVVEEEKVQNNFVNVGDSVEIQNLVNNEKRVVTIVGSSDTKAANPAEGKISTDSPIGKAVYNSKIGDTVEVQLPNRVLKYKILKYKKAA